MSAQELGALLADASQNGAYFIDVRDREGLEEIARGLGFAVAAIDFAGCDGRDEVLERFAAALRFPEWFGGNWDALADCLGDLSWWPADGYLLLLDHASAWRVSEPFDFATLLEILNDAAMSWSAQRLPFWALVPLSAAALDEVLEPG
ncbi:barstar family protein [Luteimonas mephitis]|uniref:barstar family protein n=1 Tax=Luteimonas mephitis TaxID=83615 RepID=UPI0004267599|nr:barstar family protein [Luteimonas mephitis]